ncbi:hypothetical protein PR048_014567 [Dryococelus australis]|uniref:Uncharacterized protein n=1 Tax=Dryococelus australis TaxID=614101 RepID=A0ABQ9HER5_9NEOP|nr:hypothetical protein PR048_014567 [Dryococelus australis]
MNYPLVVQTTLQPQWEHGMLQSVRERDRYLKIRGKMVYDRRLGIKELEPLAPGERVWIPDLKRQGTIQGTAKYPKSYYLSSEAVVKLPEEESRKGVPVKVTSIQGAADTARPVASGEAGSHSTGTHRPDTFETSHHFEGFQQMGEEKHIARQTKHVAGLEGGVK